MTSCETRPRPTAPSAGASDPVEDAPGRGQNRRYARVMEDGLWMRVAEISRWGDQAGDICEAGNTEHAFTWPHAIQLNVNVAECFFSQSLWKVDKF